MDEDIVFAYDELIVLSNGILSLLRDAGHAMELAGADPGVCNALKNAMDKYRELNTKVCAMAGKLCGSQENHDAE